MRKQNNEPISKATRKMSTTTNPYAKKYLTPARTRGSRKRRREVNNNPSTGMDDENTTAPAATNAAAAAAANAAAAGAVTTTPKESTADQEAAAVEATMDAAPAVSTEVQRPQMPRPQ